MATLSSAVDTAAGTGPAMSTPAEHTTDAATTHPKADDNTSTAATLAAASNLTPPASDEGIDAEVSGSELSDLEDEGPVPAPDPVKEVEEEDDIGEIEPDHYYDGGKVPVFKPTMDQFRSFKKFIDKIDKYGMKSGIVKVIPPKEWRDSLPELTDAVKTIKVKNPITQDISGSHGTYTQANIEKQRSYNLPQWKALCEEPQHQPPARRGERRRNQATVVRGAGARARGGPKATTATATASPSKTASPAPSDSKKGRGRPSRKGKGTAAAAAAVVKQEEVEGDTAAPVESVEETPALPSPQQSPEKKAATPRKGANASPKKPGGRQPKSVSERRKYNQQDAPDVIDEEAFQDFDYHLDDLDEFTAERCAELETNYWKSLTFAAPMYGADMPGSLFDDTTTSWNVAHLENVLDVLGTKVPGVNTAYLYLGMWKATFAWHLEDVDLYSINYIHFGAPKQWYSISQEDARRFEAAMRDVWPRDSKNCSQFLRHKTYLISPALLKSKYNITVNKLVHYEGEFVITFPYGYHSGYNIGYNCAESVNFATEAWLEYGRIAKKCDCEADSVWIDVAEIERKLRGEPTPEYIEETDDDDDEDLDDIHSDLPTPPSSVKGKGPPRKRKRAPNAKEQSERKMKKIKLFIKKTAEPCVLCPNDTSLEPLLPTDTGAKAHESCGLFTPETYIVEDGGKKIVCNVAGIDKARLNLKCLYCRSKRGACFQCHAKKCTRAYHATCALAAGVQIDKGPVPTFTEDGTEFYEEGFDLRCRFHRAKRPKNPDGDSLEESKVIHSYASALKVKDQVQVQFMGGEYHAGVVVENRPAERSVLVKIIPDGDTVEVEWKWLCVLDPADSQRPKPSANAKPLPSDMSKKAVSIQNRQDGIPEIGDPFHTNPAHQWQEYNPLPTEDCKTLIPMTVDFSKSDSLWHYLGKTSTEARAQYTGDINNPVHDFRSSFLDSVRPPPAPLVRNNNDSHSSFTSPSTTKKQTTPRVPAIAATESSPSSLARPLWPSYNPTLSSASKSYKTPYGTPGTPIGPRANPTTSTASTPPSLDTHAGRPLSSYIYFVQEYPYLRNAYFRKPHKYTSPYASNGGFAFEWLPVQPARTALPTPRSQTAVASDAAASATSVSKETNVPVTPPRPLQATSRPTTSGSSSYETAHQRLRGTSFSAGIGPPNLNTTGQGGVGGFAGTLTPPHPPPGDRGDNSPLRPIPSPLSDHGGGSGHGSGRHGGTTGSAAHSRPVSKDGPLEKFPGESWRNQAQVQQAVTAAAVSSSSSSS